MDTPLPIDPELFHILVCPLAKSPLKWVDGRLVSTDPATRRAYRIEEGIPIMLVDQAQTLEIAEWKRLMDQPGLQGGGLSALEKLAP
ncbi:MAG: hypothetical protein EA402_03865 [Planctomycetota bacterium]|nr:MAG: hypothetical protein EA402_03865 [Planctomycetota bacterium]